ncbi:MAG: hypothetical protein NC253_03005 [Ruminococcus sp.]|nr:hypothetical protein [Ruminococcus sp.]
MKKDGYCKKQVICPNGMIFVTKCRMPTLGSGGKREPKLAPSSERQQLKNLRRAAEKLYYLMLSNFFPGDYNIVLTYPAGKVLSTAEAKAVIAYFAELYRAYCRKNGYKPDYIYNTEVGKRGAVHHHIILHNHRDLEAIEELWSKASSGGAVQYRGKSKLNADYDWYGLAMYFVDRTKGGKLPDTHIKGERRYNTSHGLKRPKVVYEWIDADRWNKPRAPKGWYVVPDSVRSGADELTGGNFIKYLMRRLD